VVALDMSTPQARRRKKIVLYQSSAPVHLCASARSRIVDR
jgi:hypothetical protein